MMPERDPAIMSLPQHTLTLVVPCYNEEATLAHCIERVLELQTDQLKLEIIIVDDCSRDKSLQVAQELEQNYPEIRVFHHDVNRGKGAALRTGFAHATGDFVGIQDADLEYEPLEYRTLLKPLLRDEADVVFGSRYLRPHSRKVLYFWHSLMNKALTFVSNMMTNLDISDMETCYKLFRRDIIQSLDLKENRFGFEPEVVAKIAQCHCRVWEEAINYKPRSFVEGKKINWKDGVWALYCILHYSAHTAQLPMQLFVYLIIGGTSALGNILLFTLLNALDIGMTTAVLISFAGASLINYLLCIAILFRHKARWNAFGEILMYLLTISIMGGFDLSITMYLAQLGLTPLFSKTLAAIFGFFGNFLLRQQLVFPMREPFLEPLLRNQRIRRIMPYIRQIDSCHLLDIGCGWDAKLLREVGPYIASGIGVDFKVPKLKLGKIRTERLTLIDELPYPDASFNMVTMLAVLEHLEQPTPILREIRRVLTPGGKLVLTVPSKASKSILEFLAFRLRIINTAEIADHKIYYDRRSLTRLLDQTGFAVCEHRYFQLGMNNFCVATLRNGKSSCDRE